MGLLTRRSLVLFGVVAAIAVASCRSTRPPVVAVRFDHGAHLAQPGMTCGFCHQEDDDGHMQIVGPQLCVPCHEDQGRGPPDFDVRGEFDASGRHHSTGVAVLSEELRFRHGPHVRLTSCATCHGDIASSDGIPPPAIGKDDCMGCHAREGASNECSTCHREVDRSFVPPTHDTGWHERHCFVARAGIGTAVVDRCELCHERESSCTACHREQMPRDHTNFWRERGHGIAVRIDRNRCAVCHEPDACSSCHDHTRPRSHTPGFGSPRNRHCIGCHSPIQDAGCATCHRSGAPQHLAVPLPPDHHPAMNCRLCHGVDVRLPHPDPGTACTTCHR